MTVNPKRARSADGGKRAHHRGATVDTGSGRCQVCGGSVACEDLGAPVYRLPHQVAGVPIKLEDLNLRFLRCIDCGYMFVHPVIPETRLLECYTRASESHWRTGESVAQQRSYGVKARLLERFTPGRRILDFGCFDGGFLTYLGDGFERYGIEPAKGASQIAEARGIQIIGASLEDVETGSMAPFDSVVLFDVLEHLSHPVVVLQRLAEMLKPGGAVLVETGNSDSDPWRRLRQRYPYCGLVEHVGFFNHRSMGTAARRAGLDLCFFEESVRDSTKLMKVASARFHNGAYALLKVGVSLRFPLPARMKAIARGPVPRSTQPKDHFLAVLQKGQHGVSGQ